jgi:hypothetical protein
VGSGLEGNNYALGEEGGVWKAFGDKLQGNTWKFSDATVFKANSCEKIEAKISEKSEKKGSEYLKRTSESHVKRISVRLLFALKRKKFLSETGAP